MDHLSHPVSSQSQATHHQPNLRRRSRPATLRTQRRLLSRILRRRSPHSTPSDLRGYLRTLALGRNARTATDSTHAAAPSATSPQISATLPQQSQPQPRPALSLLMNSRKQEGGASLQGLCNEGRASFQGLRDKGGAGLQGLRQKAPRNQRALAPEVPASQLSANKPRRTGLTGHCPLTTGHCLYEPTMNSRCGKRIPRPRTKPVIAEDTTCGVSLLTGTISGSNFAFP
jgi:hypothetical protein